MVIQQSGHVGEKAAVRSSYKTNEIWCVCCLCFVVFFCCSFFLLCFLWKKNGRPWEKIKNSKEKPNIEGGKMHLELCSPTNGDFIFICFWWNFNGFDEIAGRFTWKVDFRKLSKILLLLSMLQKALNRRSPNPLIIS